MLLEFRTAAFPRGGDTNRDVSPREPPQVDYACTFTISGVDPGVDYNENHEDIIARYRRRRWNNRIRIAIAR